MCLEAPKKVIAIHKVNSPIVYILTFVSNKDGFFNLTNLAISGNLFSDGEITFVDNRETEMIIKRASDIEQLIYPNEYRLDYIYWNK